MRARTTVERSGVTPRCRSRADQTPSESASVASWASILVRYGLLTVLLVFSPSGAPLRLEMVSARSETGNEPAPGCWVLGLPGSGMVPMAPYNGNPGQDGLEKPGCPHTTAFVPLGPSAVPTGIPATGTPIALGGPANPKEGGGNAHFPRVLPRRKRPGAAIVKHHAPVTGGCLPGGLQAKKCKPPAHENSGGDFRRKPRLSCDSLMSSPSPPSPQSH